jgi:Rrf2 family transcriptional regulator, iron-sulfur cluster assembly transcription factor
MHLSRKAEYAVRAMTALARKPAGVSSSIEELAARERLPVKFLEQILLTLKRAGLLQSRRGVGGGYQLQRPPERIALDEILTPIDGPFQPMRCTPLDPSRAGDTVCGCGVLGGCGPGRVFSELQRDVQAFFQRTSLADVVARESGASMQFDI